jgi:hypothetical protein
LKFILAFGSVARLAFAQADQLLLGAIERSRETVAQQPHLPCGSDRFLQLRGCYPDDYPVDTSNKQRVSIFQLNN